jgi:YD repeat-containing protein
LIAIVSGITSTSYADSGVGRFLRKQADNFLEARFQSLHPKRIVRQQVFQLEEENGKWLRQPLTPQEAILYFSGSVEEKAEEYDASGRLTTRTEFSYDGDAVTRVVRKSTGETSRVEENVEDDNTIRIVTTDSRGNKIEQETYDKNMFLIARDTYSYDSAQNLVGVNHVGGLDKVAMTYSADGQELTRAQLGTGNERLNETRFRYDKAGRLKEAATYDTHDAVTRREVWTYAYDRHGFLTSETEDVVDTAIGSSRHYQVATVRDVTYVLTFGSILETAGEVFAMLIGSLIALAFLVGGFNWVRESISDSIRRARKAS